MRISLVVLSAALLMNAPALRADDTELRDHAIACVADGQVGELIRDAFDDYDWTSEDEMAAAIRAALGLPTPPHSDAIDPLNLFVAERVIALARDEKGFCTDSSIRSWVGLTSRLAQEYRARPLARVGLYEGEASRHFPADDAREGCTAEQVKEVRAKATAQAIAECQSAGQLRCVPVPTGDFRGTRESNGNQYASQDPDEAGQPLIKTGSGCSAEVVVQGTRDVELSLPVVEHLNQERFSVYAHRVFEVTPGTVLEDHRCLDPTREQELMQAAIEEGYRLCAKIPGVVGCGVAFPGSKDRGEFHARYIDASTEAGQTTPVFCETDALMVAFFRN